MNIIAHIPTFMKWIANHRFVVLKPQTSMPPQLLLLKHKKMHPLLNVNFKYEQQDQMVPFLSHCCKFVELKVQNSSIHATSLQ